ncbi:hypothetical protein ACO22_01596 [Paracoccidioides brasiliensis]|uniref:Uncharacterized protein n=1 Tax=Paracoccidioides brasiliensis TaxID=121759 RepID=A0A1D2JL62_PARBR|nr:hypothetical protein ACO22_01596 [Paracoccidioides brasiliensis]ODH50832.1 hypothetical protein GX48_02973 [Paracoccidioides brasiliensis]
MSPFRNLFPKRPPAVTIEPTSDENPSLQTATGNSQATPQQSSLSLIRGREEQPNEYKMSVVNDSGVYLPPSPTEKKSFWQRSPSQNNMRNLVNENEPFSISRESFDSYRRSFDISAHSTISPPNTSTSRTSLDSRYSRLNTPRSTINGNTFDPPPRAADEEPEQFVDVGLNEEIKPKKKGFFARLTDTTTTNHTNTAGEDTSSSPSHNSRPTSSNLGLGFHFPGRKWEQNAGAAANAGGIQAAELGNINVPISADVE